MTGRAGAQNSTPLAEIAAAAGAKTPASPEAELLRGEFESSADAGVASYRRILEEEVLPNAVLFMDGKRAALVGDFSRAQSDDHSEPQVDRERLWKYLRFSATLFSSAEGSAVCIQSRAEGGCAQCEQFKGPLHAGLAERLAQRGFSARIGPALSAPLSAQSSARGEKAFEEYLARIAGQRLDLVAGQRPDDAPIGGCDGALYVELVSHDENGVKGLRALSFLELKNVSGRKTRARAESILMPEGKGFQSGQASARRIVAHQTASLFVSGSEAGGQGFAVAYGQLGTGSRVFGPERYLEIQGADSFLKVQSFKQAFIETFPGTPIEERVIRNRSFRFALPPTMRLDVLVTRLKQSAAMSSRGLRFDVVKWAGPEADETVIVLK